MSKPDYRAAFLALSKVLTREAALNLCLVHAGARPAFSDGPDDYKDTPTWERKTRMAIQVAAEHGLEFKVSWKIAKYERWNLWSRDRTFDTSKMRAYEIGEVLGFPKRCLANSGVLKYETYGFHIMCGRLDVVTFTSWRLSESLVAEAARMARRFKRVIEENRLPVRGVRVVVMKFRAPSGRSFGVKWRRTIRKVPV